MSELSYKTDENAGGKEVTVNFTGSINPATLEKFEEGMSHALKVAQDGGHEKMTVSFKELTYINSSGLRIILTTTKTATAGKIAVKFVELDEEVYKIFEQVGYCRIFDINKA